MSGDSIFYTEVVFVFGTVLAWAVWELWSLRDRKPKPGASAQGAGHPERQEGADPGGPQAP